MTCHHCQPDRPCLLHRTLTDGQRGLLDTLHDRAPRLARLVVGEAMADVEHTQAALVELDAMLGANDPSGATITPLGRRVAVRLRVHGEATVVVLTAGEEREWAARLLVAAERVDGVAADREVTSPA